MQREFSVYLDLVRLTAAVTVFCSHMTFAAMTGGIVPYQGELAGYGVTAFFVLSGYVIAYVADTKEKTLKSFAVSRLARIYSVALPALALTIAIDLLGIHFGWPRRVPFYQYNSFLPYFVLAITFTGHAGFLNESTFGNAMFWSLDYEVWYYIIFAVAAYYNGPKRVFLSVAMILLSGPRTAILFPMWLLGVVVYRGHKSVVISSKLAVLLFLSSLVLVAAFRAFNIDNLVDDWANAALGSWPRSYLSNSQHFASHYILVWMFGLNLFAARYLRLKIFTKANVARAIQYTASFTFVLYLTHYPLLSFYSQVFHHDPHSAISVAVIVIATLLTVWFLGFVTEHRKKEWRSFFALILGTIGNALTTHVPRVRRAISP